MKKPKTSGLDWLGYSIAAFNGSGYADRSTAESFVDSYIAYKLWKKKPEQAQLAKQYYSVAVDIAQSYVDRIYAGHVPSDKNLQRFHDFKKRAIL